MSRRACRTRSTIAFLTATLLATSAAMAASNDATGTITHMDKTALRAHVKALGYKKRGGIGHDKTDSSEPHFRSLPHFNSSFTFAGVNYPFTMLGRPPLSGKTTYLKSVVIPLRMHFNGFNPADPTPIVFDPAVAVDNILKSPLYHDAEFRNGKGQFGDMLQRATFWNKMDAGKNWHVKMAPPRVMEPVDIEVTPETGDSLVEANGIYYGDVYIDFLDSQARTIMQLSGVEPDEVPVFVTYNVTAEALGYHDAFPLDNEDGTVTLQTFIYTSWLDLDLFGPLLADISTINHEMGEWLNDPFVNNAAPDWFYPPASDPTTVCSMNPYLEVGDPEGNGPTYADFPTVVVPLNGFQYHLQDLVMLPWFAGEIPSSAENGWYDFPATNYIKQPAVVCP